MLTWSGLTRPLFVLPLLFTKDVPREVIEALAGMFSGEIPWPDMPTSETALTAQLCDLLALLGEWETR